MTAQCDWSGPSCASEKAALAKCPVFDAVVLVGFLPCLAGYVVRAQVSTRVERGEGEGVSEGPSQRGRRIECLNSFGSSRSGILVVELFWLVRTHPNSGLAGILKERRRRHTICGRRLGARLRQVQEIRLRRSDSFHSAGHHIP